MKNGVILPILQKMTLKWEDINLTVVNSTYDELRFQFIPVIYHICGICIQYVCMKYTEET